jgi:hypothetical protein
LKLFGLCTHLILGTSQENDYADTGPVTDWIVPNDQANKSLKDVTLNFVTFAHEQTVLFLNMRGLTRLHVSSLSYLNGQSDANMITRQGENNGENIGDIAGAAAEESEVGERTEAEAGDGGNDGVEEAEGDENHGENNNATVYWAQFIHQCIDLRHAHIHVAVSLSHVRVNFEWCSWT